MHEFEPGQLGKLLILAGLIIATAGVLVLGLSKLGLFRLPGDIEFSGKKWRVFFPVVSCIVLSMALTWIMRLIRFFDRK